MSSPKAQATPKPPAAAPAPPSDASVWVQAQKAVDDRQRQRNTMSSSYLAGTGSSFTPNTPAAGSPYLG